MSALDLFDGDRDQRILAMWRAGRHLDEIAAEMSITWSRAAHEVNRALNEANEK